LKVPISFEFARRVEGRELSTNPGEGNELPIDCDTDDLYVHEEFEADGKTWIFIGPQAARPPQGTVLTSRALPRAGASRPRTRKFTLTAFSEAELLP